MAAWATGAWATDAWHGTAWATTTSDTHDGFDDHDGEKRRKRIDADNKRFKEKKAKLRADLLAAYNKTLGISAHEETEPAEMIQALEDKILSEQTLAGIEKRVIERLIANYRQQVQDDNRRVQEEEWDMDAMLAIAHLVH